MNAGLSSEHRLAKGARAAQELPPIEHHPWTIAKIAKLLLRGAEALAAGFLLLTLGPVILSLHAARLFHNGFFAKRHAAAQDLSSVVNLDVERRQATRSAGEDYFLAS